MGPKKLRGDKKNGRAFARNRRRCLEGILQELRRVGAKPGDLKDGAKASSRMLKYGITFADLRKALSTGVY